MAVGDDPFLRGDPAALNLGLLANGPNPGIFDTLTRLTPNFAIIPSLAERYESPTPKQWRFTLRENVKFHDGQSLDAQAVVATLETVAARQTRPRGLDPGSAKALDARVVEVNLTFDNTRLAEQLANPSMGIMAPGTRAGAGPEPTNKATGTGPFRFESYRQGADLRVVANDDYWGGAPILRSITFRFGAEADAGRLLATRQVEAVGHVSHSVLPTVSGRTDHLVTSRPARAVYLILNTGGIDQFATLKDDNVRKAVAMAIDRDAVAKAAWPEQGEVSDSLIPELVLGADAAERVKPLRRDVEGAKRLLSQAGWAPGPNNVRARAGKPLVLSLILSRPSEQQPAVAILRTQLAEAGIGLDVPDPGGENPFLRVNAATFDLFLDNRFQEDANPCSLCRFFSIETGGTLSFSASVGGGPKADDLFVRAYAAPSADSARRLAADLMEVVIADRVTAVPLATLRSEWLISPRLRSFEPAALTGDQRWDKVWLSV